MKNYLKFFLLTLFIPFIPVYSFSQDFKTIQDGIEYAEVTREIDKLPVRMNLLRLDLTKVRLDVVHAMDAAIGVETTSSIAKRHSALAAINAGFFRLDSSLYAGDAAGVLQIDGKLLSETQNNRIALLVDNSKNGSSVSFKHFETRRYIEVGKHEIDITGINRERGKDDLIEYTPELHRTTLTASDGVEIVVRQNRIVAIYQNKGSSLIPSDGLVLSATGKKRDEVLKLLKIGQKIKLLTEADFPKVPGVEISGGIFLFAYAEDIVGGIPQLIKDGEIDITWEQEKSSKSFVETRHPRTAVAKLKDGKFLMITLDGRSESSGGIGLNDLAALLLELGATDAMNLDGGGSTTMFLDGKVVNHPSDKDGERKVSDALLVFPRRQK